MQALALLCLFIAGPVNPRLADGGQALQKASASRLLEVRVLGSQRFQPPELVKATGLSIGAPIDESILKAGANRLVSSGMFTGVAYSFVTALDGTRVEYKVSDTDKLLPVQFDNFVWLSGPELMARLQSMEPLFCGELPNAGEMYLRLDSDLKTILATLNINAEVAVFPQVPPQGGAVLGFVYRVEGVKLPIHAVKFVGASAGMDPVLHKVAESSLLGSDYSESAVRSISTLDFLPEYRKRGFLRAEFGTATASLAGGTSSDVVVSLPVKEGLAYELAAVRWSGNTAYPTNELAKALKVRLGEPANQVQLQDDLAGLSKNYGTRGYLHARLQPQFTFDDAARTVVLDVDVNEGDQYRMGELYVEGLDDKSAEALRKLWKLRTGDIYDAGYPREFFMTAARRFNFGQLSIQTRQDIRRDSRTVNLTLHFAPK